MSRRIYFDGLNLSLEHGTGMIDAAAAVLRDPTS